MKFSIKDFFSKCYQIRSFLKKSLMENFIFLCRESDIMNLSFTNLAVFQYSYSRLN